MGSIYARGNILWMAFVDVDGKRVCRSTGHRVGEEKKAQSLLDALERKVAADKNVGVTQSTPVVTVRMYAEKWIAERRRNGVGSVDQDHARLRDYILPALGDEPIAEVRPRQIRALLRNLSLKCGPADDQIAPRTVRHVYTLMRSMFREAHADEVPGVTSNPCVLKKGDLPSNVDKDPTWRAGAVFTRGEVEMLISDERIPTDRRTLYALIALTGSRFGEAAARRWRDLDATASPLGRLLVSTSFNVKTKEEKGTKTEKPRNVPVHPTLAKILAEWRLGGFHHALNRQPAADDLIVPSREFRNRNVNAALKRFHEDLDRLGLRRRRLHDLRRTFISLAMADGARKDVLQWVTHGPQGDILSLYTTLPWATLCEAVSCLRVEVLAGQVIPMRLAVGAGESAAAGVQNPHGGPTGLLHFALQSVTSAAQNGETASQNSDLSEPPANRVVGLLHRSESTSYASSSSVDGDSATDLLPCKSTGNLQVTRDCSTAATAPRCVCGATWGNGWCRDCGTQAGGAP